jgi:hypothetical protein
MQSTRSILFPSSLRERLLERARVEGRTFLNLTLRMVERGLAVTEEQAEVGRVAELMSGRRKSASSRRSRLRLRAYAIATSREFAFSDCAMLTRSGERSYSS